MDGILIIDKPKGPTSHDVVQTVKRMIGADKVGHLGTLDPAATGVLPLVINGATKKAAELAGVEKVYEFTLRLGVVTDTDDDTGKIISVRRFDGTVLERLKDLLPRYTGSITQCPPAYSAVKVGGKRAHKIARRGGPVELMPRTVHVDSLCITSGYPPNINMKLECKSGTYVRSICRDLGEELGCGGHAANIRRVRSGGYLIEQAVSMETLGGDPKKWKKWFLPVDCSKKC